MAQPASGRHFRADKCHGGTWTAESNGRSRLDDCSWSLDIFNGDGCDVPVSAKADTKTVNPTKSSTQPAVSRFESAERFSIQ